MLQPLGGRTVRQTYCTTFEMSTTSRTITPRKRYHPKAYEFVFLALRQAQQELGRCEPGLPETEDAHVSGQELLEGIRVLALAQFGLLTTTVFHHWGVHSTDDFGRIVFDLIESGKMKKTERDQLSDFEDVFDRDYRINTKGAFRG